MDRRLITADDIRAAITWRLDGTTEGQLAIDLDLVARFMDGLDTAAEILDDDPAVIDLLARLKRPAERRDAWGRLCALLGVVAQRRGDIGLFYASGFDVVLAWQQSMRGNGCRKPDALNGLIAAHLEECPEIPPREVFDSLAGMAQGRGSVIADYDPDAEIISYQPAADDERLVDIGPGAVARRVQRLRVSSAFLMGSAHLVPTPSPTTTKGAHIAG